MSELAWRPWKVTVIGAGVAGATALVTVLAMGVLSPQDDSSTRDAGHAAGAVVARGGVPSKNDVEACRDYARTFAPDGAGGAKRAAAKPGGAMAGASRPSAGAPASTEARYTQAYQACMKGRGFGGA